MLNSISQVNFTYKITFCLKKIIHTIILHDRDFDQTKAPGYKATSSDLGLRVTRSS